MIACTVHLEYIVYNFVECSRKEWLSMIAPEWLQHAVKVAMWSVWVCLTMVAIPVSIYVAVPPQYWLPGRPRRSA